MYSLLKGWRRVTAYLYEFCFADLTLPSKVRGTHLPMEKYLEQLPIFPFGLKFLPKEY